MRVIHANWNVEIAVGIAIILTVGLYFLIPAICPGFPKPVVTHIFYSNISAPGGSREYYMDGRITNEGTRGNVFVTAQLINVTNKTPMEQTTQMVFMLEHEQKAVYMRLTGRGGEPYGVRFEVRRR
jgi:hypothetical protein